MVKGSSATPPCDVQISDVVVGTGALAKNGSAVEVKYVGYDYVTGANLIMQYQKIYGLGVVMGHA